MTGEMVKETCFILTVNMITEFLRSSNKMKKVLFVKLLSKLVSIKALECIKMLQTRNVSTPRKYLSSKINTYDFKSTLLYCVTVCS